MPDTEKALGLSVLSTIRDWVKALIPKKAAGIPYGECDATSTSTVFTATVTGVTEYYDGLTVMLKNGVVTSAANFTININNLGAKPCYNNMATGNDITPTAPTRDTTIFNINYTMLFVYSEDIVDGGGWICYRGYDGNTNTIGYQLRTNSSNLVAADTGYRYRIWLTSADGKKWVPINTSTSTDATTTRALNTRAIDPFGEIVYRGTNGTCNAGAGLGATGIWQQYTLSIGYSYVKKLTYPAPVFLKCTPQSDGSAVMADIVQALPSSNDGKIYIFLGIAYSATAMELHADHSVYWHDGTGIRIWTGTVGGGSSVDPATATPLMDGTAAVGTSDKYAREDHVHPTDTSRQEILVSGTNIKTVNNESLLGSGNISISGGGGSSSFYATSTATKLTSYVATEDTTVVAGKPYFKSNGQGGYVQQNPVSNPATESFYERRELRTIPVTIAGWSDTVGNCIYILMTNATQRDSGHSNTTSVSTILEINNTAYSIYYDGYNLSDYEIGLPTNQILWDDKAVLSFVYTGDGFQYMGNSLSGLNVVNALSDSDGSDGTITIQESTGTADASKGQYQGNIFIISMRQAGSITSTTTYTLKVRKPTGLTSLGSILYNGTGLNSNNYTFQWNRSTTLLIAKGNNMSNPVLLFPGIDNLPVASTSTLGGVKVDGSTVTIDENGVISAQGGGGGALGWTDISAEFVAFNDLWTGYDIFTNGSFVVIAGTIGDNYDSYLTVPNAYSCICTHKVFATPILSQVNTTQIKVDSYILGNTVYMNMNGGNEFSLIYPVNS